MKNLDLFQKGDIARVVTPHHPIFNKGELVEVADNQRPNHPYIVLLVNGAREAGWLASRFELVSRKPNNPSTMPTQPRLNNGRFTFNTPSVLAPTVAATKTVATPLTLRRGALYRIVGGSVARYTGSVANVAVFKVHGRPVAVDETRVRLADKDDVKAYLSDAGVEAR